ncbi:MAG: T9SS type A sorting domain-containing protein [Bacteroidales bacterium]
MKTKFYLLLIAIFALSISAKAQNIGGQDVVVSEMDYMYHAYSKISIANNGWIYILVDKKTSSDSRLELHRSKDNGATYQRLKEWQHIGGTWEYTDADLVVTGNNQSNIVVWIALGLKHRTESNGEVRIAKHDANGNFLGVAYSETSTDYQPYHVAISSDYRSPNSGGSPFAIAIAYTDYTTIEGKSWLNYAYSLDGGNSFTRRVIYSLEGKRKLGRVDVSLGKARSAIFGMVGIAFEMGDADGYNCRNIGFLANYMDYDNNFAWSGPINVSKVIPNAENNTRNPKVQWFGNSELNPTIGGFSSFNFIVAFDRRYSESDVDVKYVYPKTSFNIGTGHTPAISDFDWASLDDANSTIDRDVALSFDKQYNHYLATYIKEYGSSFNMMYKYIDTDKINDQTYWTTLGCYSMAMKSNTDNAYSTSIDINPTKNKVCWSWTTDSHSEGNNTVWTDAEWSTVDVGEIVSVDRKLNIFPNPATEAINIKLQNSDEYTAKIIDFQGKLLKEVSFTGNQTKISLENMPTGIYMLKINSGKKQYTEKFIKSL